MKPPRALTGFTLIELLAAIAVIAILADVLLLEPEPYGETSRQSTQWHTWFDAGEFEALSKVHNQGGNLMCADGHADSRKYRCLWSGDFGLVDAPAKQSVPWRASEAQSRAAFEPIS